LSSGPVICAEGYLFELERRGYLQAGAFVPDVVLEHAERVAQLHEEFVHAGLAVVEDSPIKPIGTSCAWSARRTCSRPINRQALAIAAEVSGRTGSLLAGNICNTNIYDPDDATTETAVRGMFEEQVQWAVEAGVEFIIGGTFSRAQEALLATEVIRQTGLPAVVTLAIHREPLTREGWTPEDACQRLEEAGADVVGLNCIRGPRTMLPCLKPIRAAVSGHVAALPVPHRTHDAEPSFQSLTDRGCECIPGGRPFPTALDPFTCNRHELGEFATAAHEIGVGDLGVCCGAGPHHIRAVAEALGRTPPASRYSPDMSRHAFLGTTPGLSQHNLDYATKLWARGADTPRPMSAAVLDFVITEHPPAITPGLERDYEIIRRRIERLAGVPVRSRHYCDAGDFAAAMILSGSFAPWELHDPASLARLGERLGRFDGAVLGICGGMQLLTIFAGGGVGPRERPAIGYRTVEVLEGGDLLNGLGSSWWGTQFHPERFSTRLPAAHA
jgi:betaine-homocysteine S-methyltransferase